MGFEKQKYEIIRICKKLFDEDNVKTILGFASGETEGNAVPFFARNSRDVDSLKWDETCTPNLARYLTERKGKAAVIAKPCDVRAIVMYMAEKQLDRENVYIIGMECAGMKDKNGFPAAGCKECTVRTPPVYDVLIADDDTVQSTEKPGEKQPIEPEFTDSLTRFQNEMKKCILCFSCRQACYGCYCKACFIDRDIPNWLPAGLDTGRKMVFHLGRAMHLAGRCVECGACERACPSGVKIRYLIKEITDMCNELYGYKAGMDPAEIPAMVVFSQNDREIGFLGGESDESCCNTKKPD